MQLSLLVPAVAVLAGAFVRAETHTIRFENKCVLSALLSGRDKLLTLDPAQVWKGNCE